MATFAGLRGTGDFAADERPKNFREMILWTRPNGDAPLTGLMSKMRSEMTDDPEFSWWEEQLDIIRITTNGDLSATSTSVSTAAGALQLLPGDVLLAEKAQVAAYDNEIVVVSSVASDTSFVIKRGQADSTAAGLASGGNFLKIGSIFAEGTASPDVASSNPTKLFNYVQIFKTAYELTGTVAKPVNTRTGDPKKNDKLRKSFRHSESMEQAWFWGKKYETTGANGKPMRFTGGLREFITTNRTIFTTTTFTEDGFVDELQKVFDVSSDSSAGDQRLAFAGNTALTNLNKIARDSSSTRINFTNVVEKLYGMRLNRWVIPQGELLIKSHPLLNRHPVFSSSMFIIDPTAIVYRHYRDTKFQDNIQNNDVDTNKGQWLTEAGVEVEFEKTMAYYGAMIPAAS